MASFDCILTAVCSVPMRSSRVRRDGFRTLRFGATELRKTDKLTLPFRSRAVQGPSPAAVVQPPLCANPVGPVPRIRHRPGYLADQDPPLGRGKFGLLVQCGLWAQIRKDGGPSSSFLQTAPCSLNIAVPTCRVLVFRRRATKPPALAPGDTRVWHSVMLTARVHRGRRLHSRRNANT